MCAKSNESESGGALTRRQLAVLIEHMDVNHRALAEAVADVPRKITESEQRLRGEIAGSEQKLRGEIAGSEQRLLGKLAESEERLGGKLAESEQRLREGIRAVDKRLNDVHTSLSGQISAVARRIGVLEPRVDAVEVKVTPRV